MENLNLSDEELDAANALSAALKEWLDCIDQTISVYWPISDKAEELLDMLKFRYSNERASEK